MNTKILIGFCLIVIGCKERTEQHKEERSIIIDSVQSHSRGYSTPQKNDIQIERDIQNGIWISKIDSLSTVEINDDAWSFKYESMTTKANNYTYRIQDRVFDKDSALIGGHLHLTNASDTLRYSIQYISNQDMTLIYLPRGNFQEFYRKN